MRKIEDKTKTISIDKRNDECGTLFISHTDKETLWNLGGIDEQHYEIGVESTRLVSLVGLSDAQAHEADLKLTIDNQAELYQVERKARWEAEDALEGLKQKLRKLMREFPKRTDGEHETGMDIWFEKLEGLLGGDKKR